MKFHLSCQVVGVAAAALLVASCSSNGSPTAPGAVPTNSTPVPSTASAPATARYRVTFQATWSRTSHPIDFPARAHFSRLVGGTHNASVRFWSENALASTGIKDMAERGRTTPLDQEIGSAIGVGTAQHVFTGGEIEESPGSVSLEFDISQTHPLVTLVSMIAPSPDWFVGVSALPLFDNGQWIELRRIDLIPWDAGTDSGLTFMSPDLVTTPADPMSRIVTAPLSPDGRVTPLGEFTFIRLPGSP